MVWGDKLIPTLLGLEPFLQELEQHYARKDGMFDFPFRRSRRSRKPRPGIDYPTTPNMWNAHRPNGRPMICDCGYILDLCRCIENARAGRPTHGRPMPQHLAPHQHLVRPHHHMRMRPERPRYRDPRRAEDWRQMVMLPPPPRSHRQPMREYNRHGGCAGCPDCHGCGSYGRPRRRRRPYHDFDFDDGYDDVVEVIEEYEPSHRGWDHMGGYPFFPDEEIYDRPPRHSRYNHGGYGGNPLDHGHSIHGDVGYPFNVPTCRDPNHAGEPHPRINPHDPRYGLMPIAGSVTTDDSY